MSRVAEHKWWCAGNHVNVAEYQGDICYGWSDLNRPLDALMSKTIAIQPSTADLDAAALLLGYHPTHRANVRGLEWSVFCDACAANLTTEFGMKPCPKGQVYIPMGGPRHWLVDGSEGRKWDVEERFAKADGKRYLYCPCPSWKFHGQECKHTLRVASNIQWEMNQ